jgi:hypothetical protein
MLIALPPYFLAMRIFAQRRTLELIDELEPLLTDRQHAADARQKIRTSLRRSWPFGLGIGLAMGLFNANPIYALTRSATPWVDIPIASGQVLLWMLIGLFACQRFVTARSIERLGAVVEFDLFRLDRLKPMVRAGLVDVLVIAGALAFAPLQSLDAEFRSYNYSFALAVAIPAAFALLVLPLRSIHLRIRCEKQRQLARVDELISEASRDDAIGDVVRFETLLAHRTRVADQPTWPISTALLSRLVVYLVIPPIAWVGAAIVETIVTRAMDL